MIKLFNILFFAVGAFVALGVFIPRFRLHWKGTRIVCGPLGCAGFGLAFMSMGTSRCFSESLSDHHNNWFIWLFVMGWVIAVAGFILDSRRAKRADIMKSFQTHLIEKKGDHVVQ
jgi:hypothetical protein